MENKQATVLKQGTFDEIQKEYARLDAALINAAPEMLKVLRDIESIYRNKTDSHSMCIWFSAKNAIAQAEGKRLISLGR